VKTTITTKCNNKISFDNISTSIHVWDRKSK